ncbi:CopG family transcriptional regulator [Pseudomonas sp. 14P_8.1_Bac3]|uniref:CopG family transcriptional regulator n=1 Tax=Pseudomonas sp. 14P_8.1_Bac3 TaxID=2971621 RepID=UPI0021C682EE|nr:CopG family transcriptional regulator [Pseudomonas sp. 14P_8.1_Bac3]MCU1760404.1 CopG family transcriptional regulator [Pseudomonas sp. 14P_8.1_Bac3]
MTGISLNLPEDLSNSLTDLSNTNGQTVRYLAMDVLRDYIEHERALTAQIELAVQEADEGKFATNDQVASMRARRWSQNAEVSVRSAGATVLMERRS